MKYILLEIFYNAKRSVLVAFLVFTFVVFVSFSYFLRTLITNIYEAYAKEEGYCINILLTENQTYADWEEVINKLYNKRYVYSLNNATEKGMLCINNGADESEIFLFGNVNTVCSSFFRLKNYSLVSGSMPKCGEAQAIIDEEYSRNIRKSIGDKIKLSANGLEKELTIVGVYRINMLPEIDIDYDGFYDRRYTPVVLCDYLSYEELSYNMDFSVLAVFIDKLGNMDSAYKELREIVGDDAVIINTIKNHAISTGTTINVLSRISNGMVIAGVGVFFVCVCIILFIWINSHSGMIMVYRALGENRSRIIGKIVLEMCIICIPTSLIAGAVLVFVFKCTGENVLGTILNISGNNIKTWDDLDISRLYSVDIKPYVLFPIIVSGLVIMWTILSSYLIIKKRT